MQSALDKAKSIKLLILDVDGVLTNGILYYGNDGIELKAFHIQDGLGIKLIQSAGIPVAIISGKSSSALDRRLKELNIEHYFLNQDNKIPAYEQLKQQFKLADHEIAYMGDDLPDLPLLQRAGLAITVPLAPIIIQQHVDLITKRNSGMGAVREACEFIMEAQGKLQSVLQSYLNF